jgi:hypothetical protein
MVITFNVLAENRKVWIINYTSRNVVGLYASNVSEEDWQENILSGYVLEPNHKVRVNIDDGTRHCEYDIKAVLEDGDMAIEENVNVCKIETWRVLE